MHIIIQRTSTER